MAEGRESEFERMYADDGAWARFFSGAEGFLGTELFRSLGEPRAYLTVDRFSTADAFAVFLTEHARQYAELDRQGDGLTVSEQEIASVEHPGDVSGD